jgi:hypothetical protein
MSIEITDEMVSRALDVYIENEPIYSYAENLRAMRAALTAVASLMQAKVPESIDTDDGVERVAKAAGWDNRRYMTPADYSIWCARMREFVRLAAASEVQS